MQFTASSVLRGQGPKSLSSCPVWEKIKRLVQQLHSCRLPPPPPPLVLPLDVNNSPRLSTIKLAFHSLHGMRSFFSLPCRFSPWQRWWIYYDPVIVFWQTPLLNCPPPPAPTLLYLPTLDSQHHRIWTLVLVEITKIFGTYFTEKTRCLTPGC